MLKYSVTALLAVILAVFAVTLVRDLLAHREEGGSASYYVSDRAEDFENLASLFLKEDLLTATQIQIDRY